MLFYTFEITVLMPVFNAEKYLRKAIDSILNQTYTDFEFLIIEDGSTDKSLSIIQSFADPRIRLIQNLRNLGITKSLNLGLRLAKGKYIARMDADDISMPERLEKQFSYLQKNPKVIVLASQIQLIDESDHTTGIWQADMENMSLEQIRHYLPSNNCLAHPSVMFRKEIIAKYGYQQKDRNAEDYGLWLRLCARGYGLEKLNEILVFYRIHPASLSEKTKQNLSPLKKNIRIKSNFLVSEITGFRWNSFDYLVLRALLNDLQKLYTKSRLMVFLSKIKLFSKILFFSLYPKRFLFLIRLLRVYGKSKVFFFFSRNCVGGAEKVHHHIVNSLAEQKPIVFFSKSTELGQGFKSYFSKKSTLFEMADFISSEKQKHLLLKILAKFINSHSKAVVFGSDNTFYYDLLPFLKPEAICIDLTHGFGGGIEHYSLKYAERLQKRVVISKTTLEAYRQLYAQNKIPADLIKRFIHIPIQIDLPVKDFEQKNISNHENQKQRLKILYVGRDSSEKRVHLVAEIAEKCQKKGINAEFMLVGNISSLPEKTQKYLQLKGEITKEADLWEIYGQSDILLLVSSREGFPLVLIEAMWRGLVAICTNIGAISEIITSGKNGFLIDEIENEDLIVQKSIDLITLLSGKPDLFQKMSQKALETAKKEFGKLDDFKKSYRQLLLNEQFDSNERSG